MDERSRDMVSRNYFRLTVGAGLVGAPLGWLFNSVEIYGIFRPFIQAYAPWLSIIPFTFMGCFLTFLFTFGVGFGYERWGFIRQQTSFLNRENNPEFNDMVASITRIEKMLKERE